MVVVVCWWTEVVSYLVVGGTLGTLSPLGSCRRVYIPILSTKLMAIRVSTLMNDMRA